MHWLLLITLTLVPEEYHLAADKPAAWLQPAASELPCIHYVLGPEYYYYHKYKLFPLYVRVRPQPQRALSTLELYDLDLTPLYPFPPSFTG